MPESPEVQELASFLTAHTIGREVRAVDVLLPKALKTQHPAPADLVGRRIAGVSRLGKMIDIATIADGDDVLHVIVHFGHDGWVLWHEIAPDGLKRAGEATLMARVRLSDGSGFDLTDAGQWKALTIHIVPSPTDVPAVAKLGLDPLDDRVRHRGLRRDPRESQEADQGAAAGPDGVRRDRQRLLRRDPARRQDLARDPRRESFHRRRRAAGRRDPRGPRRGHFGQTRRAAIRAARHQARCAAGAPQNRRSMPRLRR